MCGRLVLTSNYKEKIKAIFDGLDTDNEWLPPRYNITPGQRIPLLSQKTPRQLLWTKWGFTPPPRHGDSDKRTWLINARSETIDRLPTFKTSFRESRCIIIVDGFYEWKRAPHSRPQPYYFSLKNHGAFPVAGLLLGEHDSMGCVVITTEANSLMHPVHNRMPVIFTPATAWTWLDTNTHEDTLTALLQPYPTKEMTTHPVSDRVNRTSSDGPELINPVQIIEQTELF